MSFWELLTKAGRLSIIGKNHGEYAILHSTDCFLSALQRLFKNLVWREFLRSAMEKGSGRLLAKRASFTAEAMTLKKKKKPTHVCFVIYQSIAWNPQNWAAKAGQSAALPTWLEPCSVWVWRVSLEASLEEMSEKLIPKKKINFRGAFAILHILSHRLSSLLVLKKLCTQNSLPFCCGSSFGFFSQ